jgi:hypothetical protein
MALLTTAEAKTYLRITSDTYDSLIAEYIPLIEEDICYYLNNWFEDKVIFVSKSNGLAFSRGNTSTGTTQADYVTDDDDDFTTAGFRAGMDVAIRAGSNYGIYTLASVSTDTLTMTCTGEFEDQDQDASYNTVGRIRISRMVWPDRLKPIAAKMIWYQIDHNKPDGAISEKIDDYSVTYVNGKAYPMQLLDQLRPNKQVAMA